MKTRLLSVFMMLFGCCSVVALATAGETKNGVYTPDVPETSETQAIESYWTPERMGKAKPMPMPTIIVDSLSSAKGQESGEPAEPGYVQGCRPKASNCDTAPHTLSSQQDASFSKSAAYGDLIQPQDGSKPINPRTGPYGPFQRWTEAELITAYPKSTHGKLFFTLSGTNFVCSATVIGRSTLITAGHCISNGRGTFATNVLFCPSYRNGVNPTRGCWATNTMATATRWHTLGDPDYDYACIVTRTAGTSIANKIGNVTGMMGRAWNFAPSQAVRTFGYPQAPPFNGRLLMTTASTEWYSHDFTAGGQVSKVIGSDLTGGSSGGSWILGWTGAGSGEVVDTDGSLATDPGTNWVNGVNSHKRCLVNCNTPPTAFNGVFWQEMTSPPFRNTTAIGESEDVNAFCLARAENNP